MDTSETPTEPPADKHQPGEATLSYGVDTKDPAVVLVMEITGPSACKIQFRYGQNEFKELIMGLLKTGQDLDMLLKEKGGKLLKAPVPELKLRLPSGGQLN